MRPKKVVLCVDGNEQSLSIMKFTLETRGFRVIAVSSARLAVQALVDAKPFTIDLMICDFNLADMNGLTLVHKAKGIHPAMRTMVLSKDSNMFDHRSKADVFLPKAACIPAEILERVRILTARKRGPIPHSVRAQAVAA